MTTATQDLERFHEFAKAKMRTSSPVPTLEECLRQWRAECEANETIADVLESVRQSANGEQESLEEAIDHIRVELGLTGENR